MSTIQSNETIIRNLVNAINTPVVIIPTGDIVISNKIDFLGKTVVINPDTRFSGADMVNFKLVAEETQPLFDINMTVRPTHTSTGSFSVKWFYGNLDSADAFQKAIEVCQATKTIGTVKVPAGKYDTYKQVQAGQGNAYTSISIKGDTKPYDVGTIGAASFIDYHGKDGCAIAIQEGKGVVIENLVIYGQNRLNLTPEQVVDPVTVWNVNGTTDTWNAPYSGIGIDMIPQPTYSGSTDITIKNCVIKYFVIGVCISPTGTTQNAEIIIIQDSWIDYCKHCVTTGNSQTRTVILRNTWHWGNILSIWDSHNYGGGGCAPVMDTFNIAGSVKHLCISANVGLPYAPFRNGYAETLYSIGGVMHDQQANVRMEFTMCELNFMGGEQNTSLPTVLFRAAQATFRGGKLSYYSASINQPFPIDCPITTVDSTEVYGALVDINNNSVLYKNVSLIGQHDAPLVSDGQTRNVSIENGRFTPCTGTYNYSPTQKRTYHEGPLVRVTSIDTDITKESPSSISFAYSGSSIFPGDFAFFTNHGGYEYKDKETNAKGNNFLLGKVSSVSNGKVVVSNVPKTFSETKLRISIQTYLNVYKTHVGTVTAGSDVIKNVAGEGNAGVQDLRYGDIINHHSFPYPTRVLSASAGEVTVNNKAFKTQLSAVLTATNYTAEVKGSIDSVLAGTWMKVAWKQGDRIYNDFSNNTYDTRFMWLCTKTGIIGTPNPPKFTSK